eukprot:m.64594 g.64594  ORF g.64594 m.64594 type:complete len:268 (-) comp12536_c0_seq3:248-1051(-)
MGNTAPAHSFVPELTALCGEGENVQDKRQVNEIARAQVVIKGKFGSAGVGRLGKLKNNGIQVVVGVLDKKTVRSEVFKLIATLVQNEDSHVVRLVGVVTTGFPYFIILENCAGGDLEQHLAKNGSSMNRKAKLRALADIVDGLASTDALSIVHGHISLRSVLVFEGGMVFKIGNYCGELSPADESYYAPEVAKGTQFTSPSDVWAFAVLVHRVLGDATKATKPGERPARLEGDDTLSEVLDRCLADEPVQRPDLFWLRADFEERVAH